jgi:hypothetical protein
MLRPYGDVVEDFESRGDREGRRYGMSMRQAGMTLEAPAGLTE